MGISIQREDYAKIIDEMSLLYQAHYDEIAVNQDVIPLAPDYALYQQLDAQGQTEVVTVRDDGFIVGYAMGFCKPHLHYSQSLHFLMDIFYLKPEYRKGFVGIKLFQKLEEVLKARGVVKILLATKCHLDRSRMFEWLGYQKQEVVFQKVLT